jgi:hypothetical protein
MRLKYMKTKLLLIILLIAGAQSTLAGWVAIADFSACPRKYFPNTSGQEGPFATLSDCNSRISTVQRESPNTCARYMCKDVSSSSSSNSSAEPGHEMDKHIGDAISAGMSGQISGADAAGLVGLGIMGNMLLAPSKPLTPEEQAARIEAQRQADENARRAAEQARLTEEAYQNTQDNNSIQFLNFVASSLHTPTSAKPENQNFRSKITCKGGEPSLYTCHVMVCGGAYGGDPICCPDGFPKLNECDCNCYPANADFACKRYAACQYSFDANKVAGGAK